MPQTKSLFNRVAKHYDLLNTLFSFGMDRLWRKRLTEETRGASLILDVATGTADVAIETVEKLKSCRVIGLDPSSNMLRLAQEKLESQNIRNRISLVQGFAENLPFKDDTFDSVTIAFGIRNTVDPLESLREMKRVLNPGGNAAILEFAIPRNKLFAPIYLFYFKNILPLIASIFGRREEYEYLSESTSEFPQRDEFVKLMEEAGFGMEKMVEITMGTVILYVGVKRCRIQDT